jgi:hypothetical protein
LASFIDASARDEAQSSPNYIYILFEVAALTLRHTRTQPEVFAHVEACLTPALNYIMQQNVADMIGYAFQLYALFVANSSAISPVYQGILESVLGNKANWDKDMRYLIPALATFVIAMIYKYPEGFLNDAGKVRAL